ncbi:hypothetical protein ALC62_11466 [Cyphomyrmex costatus]|uniref:Endonuclease/exonuclease/phosphatase domain-containing protein n=1 Tax=Cyphomyrmex costatus TaxID=456900 RepID=A0A151ICP9_9HYME|nr:hypothetical protein ALC62_11466 [Cyphomyrmex costatus]
MRKIERIMEMMEREERRKNIIIKGLEGKTSDVRIEAEKVLRDILRLNVGIEEVREVGRRREGGRRMVVMKLAKEKERCGKRTKVAYGRIWMDGRWWRWDEDKERLEGAGRQREEGEKGEAEEEGQRKGREEGWPRKDEEFWKGLKDWDIIGLTETWVEQKNWGKIRGKLPREFIWKCQAARRKNRKGRAMGGIITGVREGIEEVKDGERRVELEGMAQRVVKLEDMEEKLKMIVERIKERDNQGEHILLGGDFNARTSMEGVLVEGMEEEKERCSKDKKINKDGRMLLKVMEEEGWGIMNGRKQGNEKGEWIYSGGRGESVVIDYVIGNIEAWREVKELRVEERVESDHYPISVRIERGENRNEKRRGRRETRRMMDWSEKGRNTFTRRMGELCIKENEIEKM